MAKPQPIEIPSDDCAVVIDGETYYPHEGESVRLVPGLSVGTIHALSGLTSVGTKMEAAKGEPGELATITGLADDAMQALCQALAQRIKSWTWTDVNGNPLPQPDGTTGPLQALEAAELHWLLAAVKGETGAQRKNASSS